MPSKIVPPGTRVKVVCDYGNLGQLGTVIKCAELPSWAAAFVRLDNGSHYGFSRDEIEII